MRIKSIWKLLPVVLIIGIIFFFEKKSSLEREKFKESAINSYIVKKKSNWTGGRSYDYLTKNGIVITLLNKYSLVMGDSVSKQNDTFKFKIYRKDSLGNYKYYNSYDLEQLKDDSNSFMSVMRHENTHQIENNNKNY